MSFRYRPLLIQGLGVNINLVSQQYTSNIHMLEPLYIATITITKQHNLIILYCIAIAVDYFEGEFICRCGDDD